MCIYIPLIAESYGACCTDASALFSMLGDWPITSFHESQEYITAAMTDKVTIVNGKLEGNDVRIILDSGSFVSLFDKGSVPKQCIVSKQMPQLQMADGHRVIVMGTDKAHLQLEQFSTEHGFLVTNSLITPVILGLHFLSKHKVRLDYSTDPVSIHVGGFAVTSGRGSSSNATPSYIYVASTAGGENDEVEKIAIPNFGDEVEYDIPPAPAELRDLMKRFEVVFSTVPGSTTESHHAIPTANHIHQCEFHPGDYQLTMD